MSILYTHTPALQDANLTHMWMLHHAGKSSVMCILIMNEPVGVKSRISEKQSDATTGVISFADIRL